MMKYEAYSFEGIDSSRWYNWLYTNDINASIVVNEKSAGDD